MAHTLTYIPTLTRATVTVTIVNSNFGIMETLCDRAFSQARYQRFQFRKSTLAKDVRQSTLLLFFLTVGFWAFEDLKI